MEASELGQCGDRLRPRERLTPSKTTVLSVLYINSFNPHNYPYHTGTVTDPILREETEALDSSVPYLRSQKHCEE